MYIALADRSDGELLSASYLNALSDNVEFLWGMANRPNTGFAGYINQSVSSIDESTVAWLVRHRLRYLHYNVDVNDPLSHIRLKMTDGSTVTTLLDNDSPGSTQNFSDVIDLDGETLTEGAWYWLYWEIAFASGSHSITVSRLWESDADTFGTTSPGSYAVPPRWSRGDTVDDTAMNKYKTALDTARAFLFDEQINMPVRKNDSADRGFYFVNRYRWLHYVGDIEIVDPAGVGDTITSDGNGSSVVTYDLYNVDWLTQGKLYEVKDADYAVEDYET